MLESLGIQVKGFGIWEFNVFRSCGCQGNYLRRGCQGSRMQGSAGARERPTLKRPETLHALCEAPVPDLMARIIHSSPLQMP